MPNLTSLRPSVITSSSGRSLHHLTKDLLALAGVDTIDAYLFRDPDIAEICSSAPGEMSSETVLASHRTEAAHWLETSLAKEIKIASFATYFPDIVSLNEEKRQSAINALINVFRFAAEYFKQHPERALYVDEKPLICVEIVCGAVLDACDCKRCTKDDQPAKVYYTERAQKTPFLCKSLKAVLSEVEELFKEFRPVIALEIEPGEEYVLNNLEQAHFCMKTCAQMGLEHFVGLNLDLAHLRIIHHHLPRGRASVFMEILKQLGPSFVHAHISDHPGAHTRDHPVGFWASREGYAPYIDVLRARLNDDSSLPFTCCVALELEGCNRFDWILRSIPRIKMVTA